MKKRSLTLFVSFILGTSLLFTSCIGSFGLTNKLLAWNKDIDSKFVNELVFVAFHIVPVYPIAVIADILVINSIEFWSGDNPVSDVGYVNRVETENGVFLVETKTDGYSISKEGEDQIVDLIHDVEDDSWSLEHEGINQKLLQFGNDGEVVMFLPDGQEMTVELSQAGLMAFRRVADHYTYYAAR